MKIKDIAITELNSISIKDIDNEGFIIDITEIGNSKTVTSWKVDLLYNTYQIVLTYHQLKIKNDTKYKIDIHFSEAVLTDIDENNILQLLINNIN